MVSNGTMILSTFLLLGLCTRPSWTKEENSTSLKAVEEVPSEVDGSDQDISLSSQLQEVETRSNSWTFWSDWSACSRSCDGGVSHQLRRCKTSGCKGEPIRYKICNMQSCPDSREFREEQCAAFDHIPYEGSLLRWSAHYEDTESCALTCRGRPIAGDDPEPVLLVARLANKVQDGTRCRPGSLDMCIDGECRRVGCDLRIGSEKHVDACGVCGGDGSSCARPLYHWTSAPMSLCSTTCGGGYKMSRPICQNRVSGVEVEEQLCNASQKPDSSVMQCNTHACPPKWHAGEWSACSVSCGGGSKLRQVFCVEESNRTKIRVNEHNCHGHKPRYQEPCNQMDCPKWHSSPWSGCSVSCGEGIQVRGIECRDSRDLPNSFCTPNTKPTDTQPCSTGIQCPDTYDSTDELLPGLYHTQPLVQPYPPPPPTAERLVGEQIVPSESTFIADDWGPCSVSCGQGVRNREVHCKIFLEFSRTIAKLPDKQCSGPKPMETDRCFMEPCSSERIDIKDDPYRPGSDSSVKVGSGTPGKSYSWKEQGYTHCSASCLGGVQELIINCVRDDTQKVTSPYLCPRELKPESLIRTCNDFPCPPRWNYSDFQPCTQSCGIGIQTRDVSCIHEVTQGGVNTITVPSNMCPQPPPPDRQYCNVLDCPVKWQTSDWSKCSKSCGGGYKERKVECKQVMAQNHVVDRPVAMCPSQRPPERKPCNTKSCVLESDKPHIPVSNSSYIQHDAKRKKVTLKLGGSATVFYGTMIKIKCPVKRFNRTKIQWAKDFNYLPKTKKYKISRKGALRVSNLTYRDSGVYTCVAGKSSANITISVKPRPGEFPSSEEIQKQIAMKSERVNFDEPSDVHSTREDANPIFNVDDHSHEQRPDMVFRKKPTAKTRTAKPTSSHQGRNSGNTNANSLNAWQPQGTTIHSDHDQDGILPSQLPASSESLRPPIGETPSSSAASRPMPHFQQLISNLQQLWPFQSFSNSRGHRMISIPNDDFDGTTESQQSTPNEDDEEDELGPVVILGKGNPDSLKFDWMITDWSKCSQTCGGNGFQMRASHCMVRLHNTTQDVDSNLCEDAGLLTPPTIRKCGAEECPNWSFEDWSQCDKSKCFALNTAMQRRDIKCQLSNSTEVEVTKCNEHTKPLQRQECYNEKCRGKWRVGPWSECAAACDSQGVKYRILQCVWFGTKKPAGTACRELPRPPVMKSCKGAPCTKQGQECKDHSMFCPNVKAMNLCRGPRYKQQCCHTCNG